MYCKPGAALRTSFSPVVSAVSALFAVHIWKALGQYLAEGADRIDVLLWSLEPGAHGIDRNMGCAQTAPCLGASAKFFLGQALNWNPWIDAEAVAIAARFLEISFQLLNKALHRVVGLPACRHPAIR